MGSPIFQRLTTSLKMKVSDGLGNHRRMYAISRKAQDALLLRKFWLPQRVNARIHSNNYTCGRTTSLDVLVKDQPL